MVSIVVLTAAALFSLAVPPAATVVTEPKTGVTFAATVGDMSLLGIGLRSADRKLLDQLVFYFGATKAGQECVLRWVPDGRLETTVGGAAKPPIADKAFADAVFAIWLRDRPARDPIRKQLVSRARELLK
jgi:hypothetical protein